MILALAVTMARAQTTDALAIAEMGLDDPLAAARACERYAHDSPERADARDVEWLAGSMYERVDRDLAIEFYEHWRAQHLADDPGRTLLADGRLTEVHLAAGDPEAADRYRGQVFPDGNFRPGKTLQDWAAIEAAHATDGLSAEARRVAAASALRGVLARYEALDLDGNLTPDDALRISQAEAAVKDFRRSSIPLVTRFDDFESSSAVFYLNAHAVLDYVALAETVLRCPRDFSADECAVYQEIVTYGFDDPATGDHIDSPRVHWNREQAVALAELSDLIALASEKRTTSVWVQRAELEIADHIAPARASTHPDDRFPMQELTAEVVVLDAVAVLPRAIPEPSEPRKVD